MASEQAGPIVTRPRLFKPVKVVGVGYEKVVLGASRSSDDGLLDIIVISSRYAVLARITYRSCHHRAIDREEFLIIVFH